MDKRAVGRNLALVAGIGCAAIVLSGCMTTLTQMRFWEAEPGDATMNSLPEIHRAAFLELLVSPSYVYGGTRTNYKWLERVTEGNHKAALLVDAPFSFVADTVLLPVALVESAFSE